MKLVLLTVLVAVMQTSVPVPRKAANDQNQKTNAIKNDGQGKQDPSATASPSAIKQVASTPERETKSGKDAEDNKEKPIIITKPITVSVMRDSIDCIALFFNLVLVLIGGFGVRAAYRTLKAIGKQAIVMGEQREVMLGQLSSMNEQITAISEQTAVAKESADTAKENIQLFINKERGWLRVGEPEPLDLKKSIEELVFAHAVKYKVRFSGPTEIQIIESSVHAAVTEYKDQRPKTQGLSISNFPEFIDKQTILPDFEVWIFGEDDCAESIQLSDDNIEAINNRTLFVHFIGFIKYLDTFEKVRATPFWYVWEADNSMEGLGVFLSRWQRHGSDNDNKAT